MNLDLCPCTFATPKVHVRANLLGSLSHSRQTPVKLTASLAHDLRIDTYTIITKAKPQAAWLKVQLSLDQAPARVPKGVNQRFSP